MKQSERAQPPKDVILDFHHGATQFLTCGRIRVAGDLHGKLSASSGATP